MYVKVDVTKPSQPGVGKGGNKKDKIILVDIDDLVSEATRDAAGILITGNHVFKNGAYAVVIQVTQDSISGKPSSEGDTDAEGIMQELVFAHPGSSQEIREFRSNWIGRNILAFVQKCSDGTTDQYGASCAPLRMKFEAPDDKDNNKSVFTLKSALKGPDVAIYQGTFTLAEAVALVAANATSVDLSAGQGEYQLQDNAAATVITTATNAVDGLVFTLLGSGGTHPATLSTDFILKNGTSWSGISNASITFKAFKSGPTAWKFFEQSRS
ncbi:MAG: hypothetical protein ACOYN5_04530 [Bacteroidales bacterium]